MELIKSVGDEVKRTDERKYITYTISKDQRFRDNKLYESKYLKENMELEFAIRQAQISGGTEGLEPAKLGRSADAPQWSAPTSSKNRRNAHDTDDYQGCGEDTKPDGQSEQPYPVSDGTGWENERELYYKHRKRGESFEEVYLQRDTYRQDLDRPDGDSLLTLDPVADALISAAVTVAAISDTGPVRDATTMRQHVDSKALREKRRKQIAMGHKPDDHEDEQGWTMTM